MQVGFETQLHQPLLTLQKRRNNERNKIDATALSCFQAIEDFNATLKNASNLFWNKTFKKLETQANDSTEKYDPTRKDEYRKESLSFLINFFTKSVFNLKVKDQIPTDSDADRLHKYLSDRSDSFCGIMMHLHYNTFNEFVATTIAQEQLEPLMRDVQEMIDDIRDIPNTKLANGKTVQDENALANKKELLAWVEKFDKELTIEGVKTLLTDPVTTNKWGDELKSLFEDRIPQILAELDQIKTLKEKNAELAVSNFKAKPKEKEDLKKDEADKKPAAKQSWFGSLASVVSGLLSRIQSFLRWCISFTGLVKA